MTVNFMYSFTDDVECTGSSYEVHVQIVCGRSPQDVDVVAEYCGLE